jgi:hypothetical protein
VAGAETAESLFLNPSSIRERRIRARLARRRKEAHWFLCVD